MIPTLLHAPPTIDLEITLLERLHWTVTAREVFCVLQDAVSDMTDGDLEAFENLLIIIRAERQRRERIAIKELPLFAGVGAE